MTEDEPLSTHERSAFDALPREIDPPADLEDRVASQLRTRGAFARRSSWRPLAVAALVLIALGAGFALGRSNVASSAKGDRYLLLLYGAASLSPAEENDRVKEYSDWARTETAAGHMERGERLEDDAIVMGRPIATEPPLGFFIIRSSSRAEAESIASRCPHLRHGGTVIVRPIG